MGAIFEHSLFRHALDRAKGTFPTKFITKKKKTLAPYYPGPVAQPLQRAYSAPLPGQQPYFFPAPMQAAVPYGYPPQQIFYAAPAIPQPYYNAPIPNQYSPHGSFSLTPQQTFGGRTFNEQPYVTSPAEPTTSGFQPTSERHPHFHSTEQ
jgi:hypothetical protein